MKTGIVVLALVAFAAALPGGMASAQEYVVHTFKCPPHVSYKVNWQNKIETHPTNFPLSPAYENLPHSAMFKSSSADVNANTVQCLYISSDGHPQAPYIYKAHRKIISCEGMPAATFTCRLKPN